MKVYVVTSPRDNLSCKKEIDCGQVLLFKLFNLVSVGFFNLYILSLSLMLQRNKKYNRSFFCNCFEFKRWRQVLCVCVCVYNNMYIYTHIYIYETTMEACL